jgi:hypothetical protein
MDPREHGIGRLGFKSKPAVYRCRAEWDGNLMTWSLMNVGKCCFFIYAYFLF